MPFSLPALDWPNLHTFRAPHIPKGSSRMKKMLSELQDTPRDSERYNELVKSITANFDDFKESSSHNVFNKHSDLSSGGKHVISSNGHANADGVGASKQEADAAFLNYTYKRKTVSELLCVFFSGGVCSWRITSHFTSSAVNNCHHYCSFTITTQPLLLLSDY